MTRRRPHRLLAASMWLSGTLGLLALVIGAMLYVGASEDRARHALISSIPELRSARQDETGFLEGRIAADVPPIRGVFVAYVREQYRSTTARTSGWVSMGGEVQPLTIDTSTGPMRIVNANYALDQSLAEWPHARQEESPKTATAGSIRVSGFVPGGPVLIVGRAAPGGPSDQIVALSVAGMNRSTYLDRLLVKHSRSRSLAIALMLIGPAGIAYAVWAFRRVWREGSSAA
jgi:hypothetical protein